MTTRGLTPPSEQRYGGSTKIDPGSGGPDSSTFTDLFKSLGLP